MEQSPIDGAGLAYALRSGKIKNNQRTPLLLVAINNDMGWIKEAIGAGANNILLKLFSATDLLKRVKMALYR